MLVKRLQLPAATHKLLVVRRIRNLMKRAAEHRLRLTLLCRGNNFERIVRGNVNVAPHEVDEVRPLQQQLREPGVVVVLLGDVAVAARLGFLRAHRVRHVRVEGLACETLG